MMLTLLLDLDDTLLNTNLDAFVPAYFQALSAYLSARVPANLMLHALIAGMHLMNESEDPGCTLQDVFETEFYPKIGISKKDLYQELEYFYDEIFPTLSHITTPVPAAKPFIEWAFSQGYRIAIATDPLFPRKATYHRLRWAGFDPSQFELISTFEHFRFSKTHPAYYAEMLGQMGWPDGPVLMVGNDIDRDILPAKRLGLATYHVNGIPASGSGPEADGRGKLSDLRPWLEATDLSALVPSFKTPESFLGILLASPASFSGLAANLDSAGWSQVPIPDEWSLTEVICHLRDTEREIHHMQIKLLKEQDEPFIPRPDTNVWASQRSYINEHGPSALKEFTSARIEIISMLKEFSEADWARKARHAIFGPTNFLEIIGFIADHDRLHIQQAWKIINNKY